MADEGGWHASLLSVDLTEGCAWKEIPEGHDALNYLGGRGYGVLEVCRRLNPGTNPLSPENVFVLAAGPLTGTTVPSSGRFSMVSKSPLTGTIFDSSCGGDFGTIMKKAGYDALVFTGQADKPVYVVIDPDGMKVEDAQDLWGLDCRRTETLLRKKEGPKTGILCIGPAGENCVSMASVRSSGRMLGRGGLGAILGSKRLKGIVVRGGKRTPVSRPERLKFIVHEMDKLLKAHPLTSQGLPRFGTPVLIKIIHQMGMFPSRNFTESMLEDPDSLSGEMLSEQFTVRRVACRGCPIGCGRINRVRGQESEGPEYESIWALGPQCGINDLEWISRANDICNDLGLDTISTGVTIGCAMEMVERGRLDWDLHFGDKKGVLDLIAEMAHKKGRGKDLSDGSYSFARAHGAGELAMQVKGLELPAYDPRGAQGQALGFATSNRGGCHLRSYMIAPEILGIPRMIDRRRPEGKAGLTIVYQNSNAAMDSLSLCRFLNFALNDEYYARALTAVTGVDFEAQDMQTIGERIWTLERIFNIKEGFTAQDDRLPLRFLTEPIRSGPMRGQVVALTPMLEEYYRFRDYGPDGIPSAGKIRELGLEEFYVS